jgi:hypothetical protein
MARNAKASMSATTAVAAGLTASFGCRRITGAAEPELGIADGTVLAGASVSCTLGTRVRLMFGAPVGCSIGTPDTIVRGVVGARDVGLLDAGAREAASLGAREGVRVLFGARVGVRVRVGFAVGLRVGATVGVGVWLALGVYVHGSDVRANDTWYPAATAASWCSADNVAGMLSSLRGVCSYALPDESGRPSWPCSLLPHV